MFAVFAVVACNSSDDAVNEPEPTDEVSEALPKPPKCRTGFAECNGNTKQGDRCETNTQTDPNNCGACGTACNFTNTLSTCASGTCQVLSCATGYGNCDGNAANGCEASLDSDTNNCGGCGTVCGPYSNASATCTSGTCAPGPCNSGFGDCDSNAANGCETDVSSDTSNCGSCFNSCGSFDHATTVCSSGTCQLSGCDPGWGNCDSALFNGCEQDLNTFLHCGTCFGTCFITDQCCPGTHPTTGGGTCQASCS